ncbi:MAG: hypothetical protein DRI80_13850 [Chloroflexota bacterium]|nr:MAG: hypothetical protein DRI80_13850 [Chloroflexota bacterium]
MSRPSDKPARENLRRARLELGPVEVRTVLGEPIVVGERRLTPVVRVTSFARRSGVVGTRRLGGWGVGVTRLRPLAVIETTTAGTRRIPIRDETRAILLALLAVALALPLLLSLLVRLADRLRE